MAQKQFNVLIVVLRLKYREIVKEDVDVVNAIKKKGKEYIVKM